MCMESEEFWDPIASRPEEYTLPTKDHPFSGMDLIDIILTTDTDTDTDLKIMTMPNKVFPKKIHYCHFPVSI